MMCKNVNIKKYVRPAMKSQARISKKLFIIGGKKG